MIDIVRDYAAIGVGSVQAASARAVGAGRAGAERVGALGVDARALGSRPEALTPGAALSRSREILGSLVGGDVDSLIGRLGLVKRSELNAVRQQMHRLERRLGEVRGER